MPSTTARNGIFAVVTASLNKKNVVIERLSDFNWEDVSAIRARVAAKHGKIPFQVALELPDGAGFTIVFHPAAK
ncbi:MAG: hypothetical protein NTY45_06685 [Elusimicrobia bacterium]|nr:hypothetical protein [Elusimicrobiota bacterium]